MNNIIETKNLSKSYFINKKLDILKNINIKIKKGDVVALLGPSGSGKSTFLHLIALLDDPSVGEIYFDSKKITKLSDVEKDEIRGKKISIIYQQNNLLNEFTALENVEIAMMANKKNLNESTLLAKRMLNKVGLSHRCNHFPSDLSGGEQQRVAIARAFACKAKVLFVDEPTGNLDPKTGAKISELFFQVYGESSNALIIVTHDVNLASKCDKQIELKEGKII